MHEKDLHKSEKSAKDKDSVMEVDENLPPVRSSDVVIEGKKVRVCISLVGWSFRFRIFFFFYIELFGFK